jgi:hypothetical protein
MKRSVKLGACIAAAVGIGSLVSGLAVATTATTMHPVTLCVNKIDGEVSAPGSTGQCSKSQTAIQVASAADVAALATRMDAAEQTLTNLNAATAGSLRVKGTDTGLETACDNCAVAAVTGSDLLPGSRVVLHYEPTSNDMRAGTSAIDRVPYGTVDASGSLTSSALGPCMDGLVYATGWNTAGHAVTSAPMTLDNDPTYAYWCWFTNPQRGYLSEVASPSPTTTTYNGTRLFAFDFTGKQLVPGSNVTITNGHVLDIGGGIFVDQIPVNADGTVTTVNGGSHWAAYGVCGSDVTVNAQDTLGKTVTLTITANQSKSACP